MIMPAGKPLLLPVNPRFIALSLVLALLLNMLLGLSGQAWLPDVLAVVLMFWIVHQPLRVGLTTAFVLGNAHHPLYQGAYFRLVDGNSEAEKAAMFKEALV